MAARARRVAGMSVAGWPAVGHTGARGEHAVRVLAVSCSAHGGAAGLRRAADSRHVRARVRARARACVRADVRACVLLLPVRSKARMIIPWHPAATTRSAFRGKAQARAALFSTARRYGVCLLTAPPFSGTTNVDEHRRDAATCAAQHASRPANGGQDRFPPGLRDLVSR